MTISPDSTLQVCLAPSLKEDVSFLEIALDAYPEAILLFDEDLHPVFANKKATILLKNGIDSQQDTSLHSFFPDAPKVDGTILQNMPSGVVLDSGKWLLAQTLGKMERMMVRFVSLRWNGAESPRAGLMACFEPEVPQERRLPIQIPDLARFGFVSRSHAMLHIQTIIYDIAQSGANVLIMGETGTGKEVLANIIHGLSTRRDGPLVKINCGAIPENLLEAELFGYKRGAFTDARTDKPGRFQIARGGTIVLDEIGDMPLGLQVKLLRALESQQIEPLGGVQSEQVDVRIVSSTNQELWERTEQGLFRRDLFFRINVMSLVIPPLRERVEDIPLLAQTYISEYCHAQNKPLAELSESALEILMGYPFYGNIRELNNILEYSLIFCKGSEILPEHLPAYVLKLAGQKLEDRRNGEVSLLTNALKVSKGNMGEAARLLHIHRCTLWRKMQKYNLGPNGYKKTGD